MSIASMCDRFTATLKRKKSVRGTSGGIKVSWSTDNRGDLPVSVRSDMQVASSSEREEYGIKETDIAWCMYTASDPFLETEDQVVWIDNSSILRACRVVKPSFDMAGRGRIWLTVVQEMKNRS